MYISPHHNDIISSVVVYIYTFTRVCLLIRCNVSNISLHYFTRRALKIHANNINWGKPIYGITRSTVNRDKYKGNYITII